MKEQTNITSVFMSNLLMMSTASSADSTLTIGRIGPKISSCNKYFTFWPFSFVRLCVCLCVCLSGLSVSCMSVCQCVCMCVCGGLSSSTFIRESSSLTPETTVGSIKFVFLSLPPPTTTLPALIVGFLGPRGPLGTPSSVRPFVRSSARKKNLNHLWSLINHPRIMPNPSYEILP